MSEKNVKIVFVGDSLTEDGRFTDPLSLGNGYVRYIYEYLEKNFPNKNIQVVNKGVSGNRVSDLKERWKEDAIKQNPDWISISIGINDVWRQLDKPEIDQISPDKFKRIYHKLLTAIKKRTNARIIILAPTIIGEDAHSKGNRLLKVYVQITKELAKHFNAIYIPLHDKFIHHIEQVEHAPLTTDGVHLNDTGRELMTRTWLDYIKRDLDLDEGELKSEWLKNNGL